MANFWVDNWMMQYGIRYVENYTEEAKGHLAIDIVEGALPQMVWLGKTSRKGVGKVTGIPRVSQARRLNLERNIRSLFRQSHHEQLAFQVSVVLVWPRVIYFIGLGLLNAIGTAIIDKAMLNFCSQCQAILDVILHLDKDALFPCRTSLGQLRQAAEQQRCYICVAMYKELKRQGPSNVHHDLVMPESSDQTFLYYLCKKRPRGESQEVASISGG